MAALRRGIARYANGTSDIPDAPVPAPTSAPVDFRHLLGDAIGMRGPAARAAAFSGGQPPVPVASAPADVAAPAASSGLGQLLGGIGTALNPFSDRGAAQQQFSVAGQNPAASPLTHAIGQFADYLARSSRAGEVARGPSMKDWMTNLFTGDDASTKALTDRANAATVLKDPLVQQHIMNNPDQLAEAENSPSAYAQKAHTPEFQNEMKVAAARLAEVQQNPKIPPENHHEVTNIMQTTGANSHQANASINPHAYTKEEFRKVFLGAPIQVVQSLFPELSHYITPEEALEKDYFGKVYGDYQDAVAELERMGVHDQQLKNNNQQPEYSQRPYFGYGKSKYDLQQDKVNKLNQFFMDQAAARIGVTAKPYPLPAKTD